MLGSQKKAPAAMAGAGKSQNSTQANYTSIHLLTEEFRGFIQSRYGLELVGTIRADGAFHGLRSADDKRGYTGFRYCFYLDYPQCVYFEDKRRGFGGTWFPEDRKPLSPAEREILRREFEARKQRRDRDTLARHVKRADEALAIWRAASPGPHEYLALKRVSAHGARVGDWPKWIETPEGWRRIVIPGALLVPMVDKDRKIWNLQAIWATAPEPLERSKDFISGGRTTGLFFVIGPATETVIVCEGFATGASLFEETGYRVFISFSAGNMAAAGKVAREFYPAARLVFAGDNDESGTGQAAAIEAARLVSGMVAIPPVIGDFNDYRNSCLKSTQGVI
ncbi:toprim domain-containing protein [Methylomagnum ishizawai]|uniref:toprim domain-containing protein n=1 Tax=Methylomagnum ishizawai TaxID=1760988 RepID=UPI001C8270EA|nr:toprim domain-containing protein [Methylomagnum ishizawai]